MNDLNEKAHNTLNTFNKICDHYSKTELVDLNKAMLKNYQDWTISALNLFKHLEAKQPHEESIKAYMSYCRRVLIRLSYLIHEQRKETLAEYAEMIKGYMSKKEYTIKTIRLDSFGSKHITLEDQLGDTHVVSADEGQHYTLKNQLETYGVFLES